MLGLVSQGAGAFEVKIEGVSGAVHDNAQALLQPVRDNSFTEVRQTYRAQVDRALKRALQALGYYQSIISYSWVEPLGKTPATLIAKIHLGEPVLLESTSLTVRGEGSQDPAFEALKKQLPKKTVQLNHGQYQNFKSSVERTAIRHGYFDGQFLVSELGVDAVKNQAHWRFDYYSKNRFRFG